MLRSRWKISGCRQTIDWSGWQATAQDVEKERLKKRLVEEVSVRKAS